MVYAGLFIRCREEAADHAVREIDALHGVEVHHREPCTGRLVAVFESTRDGALAATLERIRALPGVLVAEPVYRFDDDEGRTLGGGEAA